MGLFKGSITARRYRVEGEVPEDFRTSYPVALADHAFREPTSPSFDGETAGWCRVQNLLDTDFDNLDLWLFNHYLVAALRVDKKVVPAKYFAAVLDKRLRAWCEESGKARVPSAIRQEQRDQLKLELLARTLPRVAVSEFCWNLVEGWLIFHSTSESANDRFRKQFRTTFGLVLEPFSPLDFLADLPEVASALEVQGISDYRSANMAFSEMGS